MNDATFRVADRRDSAELVVSDTGNCIVLQFPRPDLELTFDEALELAVGLIAHAVEAGAER